MRGECAVEESLCLLEDIRGPFLPFVRLLSACNRIYFLFTWSFYSLLKSFITTYDFIVSSCFDDNFSLSKLFVPIQVPYC